MAQTAQPHVVVIPIPIHGHIHPFLQLSVKLASLRAIVTVVTTTSTHDASVSALDLFCGGDDKLRRSISFQALEDGSRSEGYDLKDSIEVVVRKAGEIGKLVASSAQKVGRVSVAVLDFFVFDALKDLDSLKGAVLASYFVSSAAMLHIATNIGTLLDMGFLPLCNSDGPPEKTVVDSSVIPGLPCELSVYTDIIKDPLDPTYKSMRELSNSMLRAPILLINTLEHVEAQTLRAVQDQGYRHLVNVGPLLNLGLSSTEEGQSETRTWLESKEQSSVLFVSFGTMMKLSEEQVMELGYGLEASQQNFLWVLRHTSQNVAAFLESLRQRIGHRGLIVAWSSQTEVLQHPSVGGFLTHAGWNSVLESLSYGVPMIGWPSMGDQIINSKLIPDVWKVGLRIWSRSRSDGSYRLVRRDEVEEACKRLMSSQEGNEIRARAREVKDKVPEAMHASRENLKKILGI